MHSSESSVPPTRADISDIQNAIFDGCNAVMLSGGAAVARNPVKYIQSHGICCTSSRFNQIET